MAGWNTSFIRAARTAQLMRHSAGTTKTTSGVLSFVASPDHATLTNYEARLRTLSGTLVSATNIGKPTPDLATNICHYDISGWLGTFPGGNYEVTVAAISAGGTTDSGFSNTFSLPLT